MWGGGVLRHGRPTNSEKCSSVQVPKCVSAYVGARMHFSVCVCVPVCVDYKGERESEKEREKLPNNSKALVCP